MALKLLVLVGGGWSDKTKVILNSTQFKFKLKLELSLAKRKREKMAEILANNVVASRPPYTYSDHPYQIEQGV